MDLDVGVGPCEDGRKFTTLQAVGFYPCYRNQKGRSPMPVVSGKPGSIRFRGLIRAQFQRAVQMIDASLAYDQKLLARIPAQNWMSAPQRAALQAVAVQFEAWLAAKNS